MYARAHVHNSFLPFYKSNKNVSGKHFNFHTTAFLAYQLAKLSRTIDCLFTGLNYLRPDCLVDHVCALEA